MLDVKETRMVRAEIRFLKVVARYKMTDHKRNDAIREQMGKANTIQYNTTTKSCQNKWLEHFLQAESRICSVSISRR
jgi:hypothetical protein